MPAPDVQVWLDKAAEDEVVLGVLRTNGGPWAAAAYHAQQAAGKYVKAALVHSGAAPPRTHDVERLIAMVSSAVGPGTQAAAASITAFAALTRYPGGPNIAESDVAQAEKDLATLKAWAIALIGI